MKTFLKYMIPLTIWIVLLYIIGLSVDKHWGSPYGWTIPLAFFTLGLKSLIQQMKSIGKDDNKDSAPRTSNDEHSRTRITSRTNDSYDITEEELIDDLNEGRE